MDTSIALAVHCMCFSEQFFMDNSVLLVKSADVSLLHTENHTPAGLCLKWGQVCVDLHAPRLPADVLRRLSGTVIMWRVSGSTSLGCYL